MNQHIAKLQPIGVACAGWHRFKVGDFEITAVSDGQLPLQPSSGFDGAPVAEIDGLLAESFLPNDRLMLGQNCLVVNTGARLALIDTGMGDSMGEASHMFGPSTGHMVENLRAAGFDPADIDVVILTHAHADHSWGLVDAEGRAVFPNAELALSEDELRYWTDEGNRALSPFNDINVRGAIRNLTPYLDRLIMVRDEAEVIPGIVGVASPGHSIGHHGYLIASGAESVFNIGDLAHHHVLALRRPDWEISYDTDPKLAVRSRRRILDRLATDRTPVLGYHFPWPGLGHIARLADGYVWVATPLDTFML